MNNRISKAFTGGTDMKSLALCILVGLAGACDFEPLLDEEHEEEQIGAHSYGLTGTPTNPCYTSGTTRWCQDFYSGKWCSNSTSESHIWDKGTGCNWHGWDATWRLYCHEASGWLYSTYTHRHCH
jgi:hypothetical protein